MPYAYHTPASRTTSRFWRWCGRTLLAVFLIGTFLLLVFWFRRERQAFDDAVAKASVSEGEVEHVASLEETFMGTVELAAVNGALASGTASRSFANGTYHIELLAKLPAIDQGTTFYEAWFVKPGITDFFSLGEMVPRDDGRFGLVWEVLEAQTPADIPEFSGIVVMREPRNDDAGPSGDGVLSGVFE